MVPEHPQHVLITDRDGSCLKRDVTIRVGFGTAFLRVDSAAISTFHEPAGGLSVDKHPMLSKFLKGARFSLYLV